MNRIMAVSKYELKSLVYSKRNLTNKALVIISDWNETIEQINEYTNRFKDVLVVHFMDTELKEHPRSINHSQAESIKRFILKYDDIIVQCEQGQSRSVAIVCATLLYAKRYREELQIWKSPYLSPNILVYKTMCDAFQVPCGGFRLWVMKVINNCSIKREIKNGI